MKGTILTNAFDHNGVQQRKVLRMQQEFCNLGVQVDVVSNDKFVAYIDDDGRVVDHADTDFVLFFDKDKYTARLLEKQGVRLFNRATATEICDDKMLTHIVLADNGVPMPTTLSGALCYTAEGKPNDEYLQQVVDKLGFPLVVKQCYGSFGEQVYLVKDWAQLVATVDAVKDKAYLFQRYVSSSHGKDMRVIVIGGKVACAMLRQSNDGDFRSNVAHGGSATAVKVPLQIAQMCQRTAEIIGLDYCGIDVLLGEQPLLCEVNSNAMFEAMEKATGVNVAKLYCQHIVDCVNNGK